MSPPVFSGLVGPVECARMPGTLCLSCKVSLARKLLLLAASLAGLHSWLPLSCYGRRSCMYPGGSGSIQESLIRQPNLGPTIPCLPTMLGCFEV